MPGGRPTKFKPEYNEQVEKLCRLGATDNQLADFFGVHSDTIQNWKKEHSLFFESIKRGKLEADVEIANALYHRAKGYSCPDTKAQWVTTVDSETGKTSGHWEYAEMTKHYPPDSVAIAYWLNNRQPELYRQKQEFEHKGDGLQTIIYLPQENDDVETSKG